MPEDLLGVPEAEGVGVVDEADAEAEAVAEADADADVDDDPSSGSSSSSCVESNAGLLELDGIGVENPDDPGAPGRAPGKGGGGGVKACACCAATRSGFSLGFLVEVPFRTSHIEHLKASALFYVNLVLILQMNCTGQNLTYLESTDTAIPGSFVGCTF